MEILHLSRQTPEIPLYKGKLLFHPSLEPSRHLSLISPVIPPIAIRLRFQLILTFGILTQI